MRISQGLLLLTGDGIGVLCLEEMFDALVDLEDALLRGLRLLGVVGGAVGAALGGIFPLGVPF